MRSIVIVALQLSLIVAIMLPLDAGGWSLPATALVGAGIAMGAWALTANRPGNFNIRPDVKPGGRHVTQGPYAYVRHPMYLAVMLGMLGFCPRLRDAVAVGGARRAGRRAGDQDGHRGSADGRAPSGLRRIRPIDETHRSVHLVGIGRASSVCPMATAARVS